MLVFYDNVILYSVLIKSFHDNKKIKTTTLPCNDGTHYNMKGKNSVCLGVNKHWSLKNQTPLLASILFWNSKFVSGVFLNPPSHVANTWETTLPTSRHVTQVCSSTSQGIKQAWQAVTVTNLQGLYFEVALVWRATRQAIALWKIVRLVKTRSKHRQGDICLFVPFSPRSLAIS